MREEFFADNFFVRRCSPFLKEDFAFSFLRGGRGVESRLVVSAKKSMEVDVLWIGFLDVSLECVPARCYGEILQCTQCFVGMCNRVLKAITAWPLALVA